MTPDDFPPFTAEIQKMFLANGRESPNGLVIDAYWETLEDLSWDEFKAGVFNARQNNERGFLPSDGVIREEALKARSYLYEKHAKEQRARALAPVVIPGDPRKWPKVEVARVEDLVVEFGKAADLAQANCEQAKRERNRCMPGDPALEQITERILKYTSNRAHYLQLQRQYQEMLDDGEELATREAEDRALTRRAKRATEQWENRI